MFGSEIQFKYKWRPYQERVLNNIEKHLEDDKLHIIAPPGSGKTVLGLEVVRHLNKATLILSPSITIRNQWIDRFVELFAGGSYTDFSFDLKTPATLTSTTYQSLYSLQSKRVPVGEESDDLLFSDETNEQNMTKLKDVDLVQILKKQKVEVLVLDEAHHLRAEWWKSLMTVVKGLPNLKIIALTATPPYDSSAQEWERYSTLCGPVDAEITVPELVREKNLCPHQDLVYQSSPTKAEFDAIDVFYSSIRDLSKTAVQSEKLEYLLVNHPVLLDPENHLDEIYSDIEYYASIIIYLHYKEHKKLRNILKIMGMVEQNIPALSDQWLVVLLSSLFYRDLYLKDDIFILELRKIFKKSGAIERRKVILSQNESLNKLMGSSLSKFDSIRDIVDLEYEQLKSDLRLVVLSDFVRKEALKTGSELTKFGVIPILRYLYDTNTMSKFDYSRKIAVLSGSVCVIPDSLKEPFLKLGEERGICGSISFLNVPDMTGFSEVLVPQSKKSRVVGIMTELFSLGKLNILIGTKSLLGEGWDCPAVNSLVLATFVGSYMLSNQMRGRAIRTDKNIPEKTSNIWHLMCRDLHHKENDSDLQIMTHRFRCFTGLDAEVDLICNGLERTGLSLGKDISSDNEVMRSRAIQRSRLYERWFDAITMQKDGEIVKAVKTRKASLKRSYVYTNTLKYLIFQSLLYSFGSTCQYVRVSLEGLSRGGHMNMLNLLTVMKYGTMIAAAGFLFPTIKAIILMVRHGSPVSSFKQIAQAILDTMADLDMLEDSKKAKIVTYKQHDGSLYCELRHSSPYEQSLFLSALEEVLGAVKNPRYLLTRESSRFWGTRDFHSVPSLFGGKKDKAEKYFKNWQKHMGKSRLFYTRNREGRTALVYARSDSLSSAFQKKSEIIDSWKS